MLYFTLWNDWKATQFIRADFVQFYLTEAIHGAIYMWAAVVERLFDQILEVEIFVNNYLIILGLISGPGHKVCEQLIICCNELQWAT